MRFRYQRLSGEVQHSFDGMRFEGALKIFRFAQITFDEFVVADKVSMPGGEIVEDDRLKTAGAESVHGMCADVTGTTCNKNHDATILLKYSMVSATPRSTGNSGCHPSSFCARPMLGQRTFGSSTGKGSFTMVLVLFVNFRINSASSRTVRSPG